jgi:hypothetical protein
MEKLTTDFTQLKTSIVSLLCLRRVTLCRYAGCCYAKCRYAECRGAFTAPYKVLK